MHTETQQLSGFICPPRQGHKQPGHVSATFRCPQDEARAFVWQPGNYVRVHGNLRRDLDKQSVSILAYHIRPITDFNEVRCCHLSPYSPGYMCTGADTVDRSSRLEELRWCLLLSGPVSQITYHNLQCIFQHLYLTKGQAAAGTSPQPPAGLAAQVPSHC